MEKKKPTIDEIYKLNVDGLFESTANWFDNAFKKSQAEINRDLYNKINGYSSSSESTGGNVSLGPLLTSLNGSNLYPSRGYLYYNGNDWEFNTPTVSGGGGGVVDTAAITKIVNDTIKNVSWWGQKINNNKVDGNIVITKGSHSFTIELDDNGNLKFNGNIYATGGITALGVGTTTGGGSGASLGTLLTKLNSDNPFPTDNGQVLTYDGSNFVWKIPTGSGSSSRISYIRLFNSRGESFETIDLGTADTIGFMAGNNVSLEAVAKEFTNVIKISATGGSGGSGGSTSTNVSWEDVTNKPSEFTPSSHTHSASDITGLSGVKVNNAIAADRLANAVTLWGNNFSGNNSIGTSSTPADLRYVKDIYAGDVFDIKAGNNSLLKVDGTPTIYVGFGYMADNNARLLLFGNKTTIYTSSDNYRYDFKGNVFDINSNQIHFGSETNGGKISWDAANNAFKIEGNVYATGGITALGVSNNATTSNNVDFTFGSVTANTFNVMDSIQLSDGLKLKRNVGDIDLVSTDGNLNCFFLDGNDENYYLNTNGEAFFSNLNCESLSFSGINNFDIVNANNTTFTIKFEYNGRTYNFTPSEGSVTVS